MAVISGLETFGEGLRLPEIPLQLNGKFWLEENKVFLQMENKHVNNAVEVEILIFN